MNPRGIIFVTRRRAWRFLLLGAICSALALPACGKKGPLYLPKDAAAAPSAAHAVIPASVPSGHI